jgi:hypothetical protein
MALGDIKTFTYDYGTLKLEVYAIDMGNGDIRFEIKSLFGSADINAIYWSDGNTTAGEGTLSGFDAKKDSALNMNGSGEAWDGGLKLSNAGIGTEGLAKETYLQEGESVVRTVKLNWDSLDTFGIRATSTTTAGGSIKAVDGDAVVDTAPVVSINDITVTEGVNPTATFTVSLDSVYTYDVYVTYNTSGISAFSPGDFSAASGTIKILAGQTSASITIAITDDLISEATETFHVNLTGATLDIPGTDLVLPTTNIEAFGVGTILDNDVVSPPGGGEPPAGGRIAKSQGFWDTHDGVPNANEWDISGSTSFETYFAVNGPYSGKWDPSAPVDGASGDLIESPTFSEVMTFKNGSDNKNLLAIEAVTAALNLAEDDLAGVNDSFAEWYIYQRKNFSAADSDADDDLSGYSDAQLLADLKAQVQDAYAGSADAYTVSELAQLLKATHE